MKFSAMRIEGLHDYEDEDILEEIPAESYYKPEKPNVIRRENVRDEREESGFGECEAEDEMDDLPIYRSVLPKASKPPKPPKAEPEPLLATIEPLSPEKLDLIKRSKMGEKSKIDQKVKKSSIRLSRLDSILP